MTRTLTTRPNLDHFRGQAKTLLAELRAGDPAAARTFIDHLPKARGLSLARARAAGFRLADAQSVVARRSGFASWPALVRHVEQLRALEGAWSFEALEVDGNAMPRALIAQSKLLLDGDRLTICLGVVGASRPAAFATGPGSGHALERLRRASAQRPAGVTGGIAEPNGATESVSHPAVDPAGFADATHPMLPRLEGTWVPVRLVTNGEEMRAVWLAFGSRTGTGNEVKVVFGGQVMLHARLRIDDTVAPVAVDYLHLGGAGKGKVSHGILEWLGEEVRFLMAAPGQPRPSGFAATGAGQTLSHWRRSGDAS